MIEHSLSPASTDLLPICSGVQPASTTDSSTVASASGLDPNTICTIFNSLETGVVICNSQRTITVINQVARQLLLPSVLADATALDNLNLSSLGVKLYEPGCRDPLALEAFPLWRLLAGEELHDVELTIVHPQGDRYWVLVGGRQLVGAEGSVIGAVMSLYDITQRHQEELALRTSNSGLQTAAQQRLEDLRAVNQQLQEETAQRQQAELALKHHHDYLQTIFDTEPASVQVITPDRKLQFINRAGLALLAVDSPEDVLGKSIEPTIAPAWQAEFWQLHGRICRGEKGSLEFELIGDQDTHHWVEAHAAPLFEPTTGQTLNLMVMRDITHRKETEQALRNSEHLFSTVANASPAMIWMTDTENQCIYVNQPWLKFRGRTLAQEAGDGWLDGVHPQDVDPCVGTFLKAVEARQPFSVEYRLYREDGEERWITNHGQPHYAPTGQYLGYVGTCIDTTERRHDEATLRLFFDLPFIGMAVTNPNTRQWVRLNDRLCEILGYSREVLQQMTWTEITHPDDLPQDVIAFNRVITGETDGYTLDKRFIRQDGAIVYATINVKCIRQANGQVDFFVATVQDITDRQLAANALARSEERYREMFDANPHPMCVIDTQTLRFLAVNRAAIHHYGYSKPEFLNLSLLDIRPPEDIPQLQAVRSEDYGQTVREQRWRHLKKDGSRIEVEITSQPMTFEGRPARVALMYDVTERRRAEALLQESEERFRATFEQAAVGIAQVAPDGVWLRVNQTLCQILGYSRQEMLGLTFQDITHPDDLAVDLGYVNEMLTGQRQAYSMEKRYIHKDRSCVWVNLTASLVRDSQGQPKYFISVIQDISAVKQAQDTLQHYAQRLQGLHQLDRAILAKFLPQAIASSALALLRQLVNCQQGIVALFNLDDHYGEVIADTSDDAVFPAGTRLPLTGFAYGSGDISQPLWRVVDLAKIVDPPLIFQSLRTAGQQSVLTAPLVVNHAVIGELILADPSPDHFKAAHDEIVQEVADHLAIALQNARLLEQVQHDRQRLQDLSNQLLEAQEAERRWLAHELHDEVGQALTAVKLNLQRLKPLVQSEAADPILTDCLDITQIALQQVRNLSLDLRPSMLDDLGLVPALRWYVSRHAERTGLHETLVCDPGLPRLLPQVETACFRVVQESLTNIARHAQAHNVTVNLTASAQCLYLSIHDDGIGFNVEATQQQHNRSTSLGLLGMAERSQLIGGQLTITSRPGQGTRVDLCIPRSDL